MSGLVLDAVRRSFAGVVALDDVHIVVESGQVVGLVGPNGSGKTTAVNVASGAVAPDGGTVVVDGVDLTGRSAERFAAAGVIRTFQNLRLFDRLTVLDNVLVGAQRGARLSAAAALARTPGFRRHERHRREAASTLLERLDLTALAGNPVATLSHGQRRRVELARALAAAPRHLVLDEPGAGVAPAQLVQIAALIREVAAGGVGVLVVEHDIELLRSVSDVTVGLVGGRVVATGDLAIVTAHPAVSAHLLPAGL